MRPLGFTLAVTLVAVTVSWAQQPGTPGLPPGSPIVPAAAPATPNILDAHLDGWERTMREVKNFRVEIASTKTDCVFKKDKKYDGVVLCMKPNFAILRLNYTADLTKNDYEAVICNGKSFFHYNGNDKTVTEHKLPNPANNAGGGTDNIMLDFVSGLKAKEAKQRFDISLLKEDDNYIYLKILPVLDRDKQDFQQINLALYGPKTRFAYLPARVNKLNPNGDQEVWDFLNPQTNLTGIEEKHFQYVQVTGFTYRLAPAQAPPMRPGQPPILPGSNGLPPGPGGVRP
jgi:TIGR03009 family protein